MNQQVFKATAIREGRWWVVDVDGVGVTQGHNAAEAKAMAVDLVEAMLEIDSPSVEVEFVVGAVPPAEVRHARTLVQQLAEVQRETARVSRQVAAKLSAAGLTGADTAALLGISPQRVSQLLQEPSAAPKKAAAAKSSRTTKTQSTAGRTRSRQGAITDLTKRRAGKTAATRTITKTKSGRAMPKSAAAKVKTIKKTGQGRQSPA